MCFQFTNDIVLQPWPNLHSFKSTSSFNLPLNDIFIGMPQLISLIVPNRMISQNDLPNFRLASNNLQHLAFACTSRTDRIAYEGKILFLLGITFDDLTTRSGLNTLTKLKELELKIEDPEIDRAYLDGFRWGAFISNSMPDLSTFNFCFSFSGTIDRSLGSFRTQFWLDEKKWFVALQEHRRQASLQLFTVPRFHRAIPDNKHVIVATTSPSSEHLNSNIKSLFYRTITLQSSNLPPPVVQQRYEHIERLDFTIQSRFRSSLELISKLNAIFNFNTVTTVRCRVFWSCNVNYQQIFDLLNQLPHLSKVILDHWPKLQSCLQVTQGNHQVSSVEVRSVAHVFQIFSCLKNSFSCMI